MTLTVRTVAVDEPFGLLASVAGENGLVWMRQGEGLVGWGEAVRLDAGTGPDRFERATQMLKETFGGMESHDEVSELGTGPVAFGAFTFDPDSEGSCLIVPSVVLGRRGDVSWMTVVEPAEAPTLVRSHDEGSGDVDRIRYAGSTISEVEWLDAVAAAAQSVRSTDLEKVVLARDLLVWSKSAFDQRRLAARLAESFPQCFTFSLDGMVGATPELLVRVRGKLVESTALAGSAARGSDHDEDERLGRGLLSSAKDRAEHLPAVASVRVVLERLCSSLHVDPEPKLMRLANVQHLATEMRGRLRSPIGALEVAGRLHPTAAVCGAPTNKAQALIRTLEKMDRGRYGGPVGWVGANGDGEWGIALRCGEFSGTRGRLFAGAGIVAGSLPESELEETRVKLRAMQSALAP